MTTVEKVRSSLCGMDAFLAVLIVGLMYAAAIFGPVAAALTYQRRWHRRLIAEMVADHERVKAEMLAEHALKFTASAAAVTQRIHDSADLLAPYVRPLSR